MSSVSRSAISAASSAPISAPRCNDPNIDFATLAKSMGVYAQGPIDQSGRSRPGDPAGARRGQEAANRRSSTLFRSRVEFFGGTVLLREVFELFGRRVLVCVLGFLGGASAQDTPRGNCRQWQEAVRDRSAASNATAMQGRAAAAGPKLIDPPPFPAFIVQLRTPPQCHAAVHGEGADRPAGRRYLFLYFNFPEGAGRKNDSAAPELIGEGLCEQQSPTRQTTPPVCASMRGLRKTLAAAEA